MKITSQIDEKIKDKVENVKQTKKEVQHVLQYSKKPKNGHTLFCFNTETKEITIANYLEIGAVKWADAVKGFISPSRKVEIQDNCIYEPALNKKNFIKILKRDYKILDL